MLINNMISSLNQLNLFPFWASLIVHAVKKRLTKVIQLHFTLYQYGTFSVTQSSR